MGIYSEFLPLNILGIYGADKFKETINRNIHKT